jgi:hypothetical protein
LIEPAGGRPDLAVETASGAIIDILNRGGLTELGIGQAVRRCRRFADNTPDPRNASPID